MPNLPIKITQISKDFNIKSKDVLDTFKDVGLDKKSGGSADADEFELFMSHLMNKHQIKDLDAYRDGRIKISSGEKKESESVAAPAPKAPAPAAPKAEPAAAPKAAPAPKAEPAPEKKPQPKPEAPIAKPKQDVQQRPDNRQGDLRARETTTVAATTETTEIADSISIPHSLRKIPSQRSLTI